MTEKIILDTDIGSDVDDALALLYCLNSKELDLKGITTVYGDVITRAKIAKKIVDNSLYEVPVYVGEGIPIRSGRDGVWHTGREGDGALSELEMSMPFESIGIQGNAVEYLIEEISSNKGEYNLVSIGALTNAARALEKNSDLEKYIKHHYIMGGGLSYPEPLDFDNFVQSKTSEHNFFCDIEAAKIVLNSNIPKTLIPLDITTKTGICRKEFNKLHKNGDVGKIVDRLVDEWFNYRDDVFGRKVSYTCMHDPLTLMAITHPDIISYRKLLISVDYSGVTLVGEGNDVNVGVSVDHNRFKKVFLDAIKC